MDSHVVIVSPTLPEVLIPLRVLVLQAEHGLGPLQQPSDLVLSELLLPHVLGWSSVAGPGYKIYLDFANFCTNFFA